jgi:hypothetical protein
VLLRVLHATNIPNNPRKNPYPATPLLVCPWSTHRFAGSTLRSKAFPGQSIRKVWTLCFWSSNQPTMELINPRFAIDSAERTKLEMRSGQNSGDAAVVLGDVVDEAGVARWKCCVMPILKIFLVVLLIWGKREDKAKSQLSCQERPDVDHIIVIFSGMLHVLRPLSRCATMYRAD